MFPAFSPSFTITKKLLQAVWPWAELHASNANLRKCTKHASDADREAAPAFVIPESLADVLQGRMVVVDRATHGR